MQNFDWIKCIEYRECFTSVAVFYLIEVLVRSMDVERFVPIHSPGAHWSDDPSVLRLLKLWRVEALHLDTDSDSGGGKLMTVQLLDGLQQERKTHLKEDLNVTTDRDVGSYRREPREKHIHTWVLVWIELLVLIVSISISSLYIWEGNIVLFTALHLSGEKKVQ